MSRYIDESIKSLIYDLETEAKSAHDDDPDNEYLEGYFDGLHHAVKELSTAPTVDAVQVVRCRDCKHTKDDGCGAIYCKIWDKWEMPEDFFCADGERRQND